MSDFCGRINRIQPPEASAAKLCDELHQMGFCRGRDAAAEIAAEADELVGELVEALDQANGVLMEIRDPDQPNPTAAEVENVVQRGEQALARAREEDQ